MRKPTLKRGRPARTTIARAYTNKFRAFPPVIVHGKRARIYAPHDGGYLLRFDSGVQWYAGNTKCSANPNR